MIVTIISGKLTQGSPLSAGFDIHANESLTLSPGERRLIKTNLKLKMENCWGKIFDRSSMGKKGILTAGGVIDEDYTGEVGVILKNLTDDDFQISYGDRIAQIVFFRSEPVKVVPTAEGLLERKGSVRGDGGFGSTGK